MVEHEPVKNKWKKYLLWLLIVLIVSVIVFVTVYFAVPNNTSLTRESYPKGSEERQLLEEDIEHTHVNRSENVIEEHKKTLDLINADFKRLHLHSNQETQSKFFTDNIGSIVYISPNDSDKEIEEELITLAIDVPTYHLKSNIAKQRDRIKSHLACYDKCRRKGKNMLIIEPKFKFNISQSELEQYILKVHACMGNRWDVISFDQNTRKWQPLDSGQVYRLFEDSGFNAYLVNHSYIDRILAKCIKLLVYVTKNIPKNLTLLNDMWRRLQEEDHWIGFKTSIGYTSGKNVWKHINETTCKIGKKEFSLNTMDMLVKKKIAVWNIATAGYTQFIPTLHTQVYNGLFKNHDISMFLFTDDVKMFIDQDTKIQSEGYYKTQTKEGLPLYVYEIEHNNWPEPSLKRFHYLLNFESILETMDHIMYIDADYAVIGRPKDEVLMKPGITVVEHLEMLLHKEKKTRYGPTVPNKSQAYIRDDEHMKAYVAGGTHMGTSKEYIEMAKWIKERVDIDTKNNVMATCHDESFVNKYVVQPGVNVNYIGQSYIFDEACFNPEATMSHCIQLREQKIEPIMIPLQKNHAKVRSK